MIRIRNLSFPKNFVWGFAAAAPQIEGAAFTDGKGESIWDRFARTPGKVRNGDNLDIACEHYTRYNQDFKLMRSLGAKNYRLSLAWPRIIPDGDGAVNLKGLDFYHRLFDSMEKHGLTPWVTMFHWDLPQSLETRYGGWRDRRVADAFAKYADTIVQAYGDRVKNWITLNEVFCFTHLSYGSGQKAPGLRLPMEVVNQTYHHALLCHGHGVRAVREYSGKGARVGITDNSHISIPVTETEADIKAASLQFRRSNWRVIDAIYRGGYDPAYLRDAGKDAPKFEKNDFKLISLPTDFLGMNIYSGNFVRAGKGGKPEQLPLPDSFPETNCRWHKIIPQSLYWGPRFVAENYGEKSIYITENGCGYHDAAPVKGEVNDLHRRDLLRNYLGELRRACVDGVPVHGYFLWSFMDNYEWEDGYDMRFGVVYCDFKTQKRTPKLSAKWYSEVMKRNALV
jgi:beta-glucosidase